MKHNLNNVHTPHTHTGEAGKCINEIPIQLIRQPMRTYKPERSQTSPSQLLCLVTNTMPWLATGNRLKTLCVCVCVGACARS